MKMKQCVCVCVRVDGGRRKGGRERGREREGKEGREIDVINENINPVYNYICT